MTNRLLLRIASVLAAAMAPAAARAEAPKAPPATAPAVGPAERKILQDLEKAGEKFRTIRADIDYRVDIRTLGDSEQRTGWVAYQKRDANSPSRFRVTFETLRQGTGRKIKAQVDYAFDGQWLTVAKHKIKNMTMYQLAAKGQHIEPLRIGRGPFPLPFGQKADDVIEHFAVTTRAPRSGDPKDTVYLRLTARAKYAKKLPMERLELWIDRESHLPVKIKSRDKTRNITTVEFKNVRTNRDVPADVFRIPRRAGWETIRRPLKAASEVSP